MYIQRSLFGHFIPKDCSGLPEASLEECLPGGILDDLPGEQVWHAVEPERERGAVWQRGSPSGGGFCLGGL